MTNESQFELFSQTAASSPASSARALYFKPKIILTFDNLIVILISLLLTMVLMFSIGVERGKGIARVQHKSSAAASPNTNTGRTDKAPDITVRNSVPAQAVPAAHFVPVAVPAPAEQPPAVVKAPGVAPSLQDVYTVQVASFKQAKYAQQEAMALKQKGYEILVIPKGQHSIVCVGKFVQKQEATAMSGKLRKYYKDCVVRNL